MAEQRAMEEAANPDHRSPDIPLRLHRLQDLILTRVDVDVRNDPGDRERMQEFLGMLAEEAPDPKVGDILTGPVSCTNDRGVYLDVPGLSLPAFMPWSEVSLLPLDNPRESFPEGQVVSAKVIALDKFPVVSLRIAEFRAAWQRLVGVHGAGGVVDVTVTDVNRGGALCACHGLRGFIPSSHFIGTPDPSHIGKQYKVS
jgi:small subunit ribosomal protein S1